MCGRFVLSHPAANSSSRRPLPRGLNQNAKSRNSSAFCSYKKTYTHPPSPRLLNLPRISQGVPMSEATKTAHLRELGGPTRAETDSMGAIEVPTDRYYGAQTARSLIHFAIGK